ncbi:hypothetical protein [Vibrio alginolyticus]|nr:hypothetical protein [Vibrio alginolyticus]ULF84112.1 hypothetical protein K6750_15495 [Vibrio alginolyticus]
MHIGIPDSLTGLARARRVILQSCWSLAHNDSGHYIGNGYAWQLGKLMRPTTVRFAHTNTSAMRRRSGFTTAPKAKQVAPAMTLVEKTAMMSSVPAKVIKAA